MRGSFCVRDPSIFERPSCEGLTLGLFDSPCTFFLLLMGSVLSVDNVFCVLIYFQAAKRIGRAISDLKLKPITK